MCEGRSFEFGEVVIGFGVGSVWVVEVGISGDFKEVGMVEVVLLGCCYL